MESDMDSTNPVHSVSETEYIDSKHLHNHAVQYQTAIAAEKEAGYSAHLSSQEPKIQNNQLEPGKDWIISQKILNNAQKFDLKQWLSGLQDKFKSRVVSQIENQFAFFRQKFATVTYPAYFLPKLADIQSQNKHTQNVSKQLSLWIQQKDNELERLLQNIEHEIAKISSQVAHERVKHNILDQAERQALKQYIFEEKEGPYNKIPKIFTAMKELNYPIYAYQQQQKKITLGCSLCNFILVHSYPNDKQKAQIKKTQARALLQHLYKCHYTRLSQAFRYRIIESNVKEITFKECLREAKHYPIIAIIDRSSNISNTEFYQSFQLYEKGIYPVEVVSSKNAQMKKGRYIQVKELDTINLCIAAIATICHLRGQKVHIESKKKSFSTGLSDLLSVQLSQKIQDLINQK